MKVYWNIVTQNWVTVVHTQLFNSQVHDVMLLYYLIQHVRNISFTRIYPSKKSKI